MRRGKTNHIDTASRRLTIVLIVLSLIGGLLIFRLFSLQVLSHSFYSSLASGQHELLEILQAKRGEIFMRDFVTDELFPIASNQDLFLLYSNNKLVDDPYGIAVEITPILVEAEIAKQLALKEIAARNLEEEKPDQEGEGEEEKPEELKKEKAEEEIADEIFDDVYTKLSKKDDPYEPLAAKLDEDTIGQIKELGFEGLGYIPDRWRLYPEKNLGSHITGFVGLDKDGEFQGQYGLEGYFNEELQGKSGSLKTERDISGRRITIGEKEFKKAEDGSDLILTIDRTIQFFACDRLQRAVKEYEAEGGSVVIVDPSTGAVRAMCNFPDFDPNFYSNTKDPQWFNNSIIFNAYEPGSIFKPITMAAALESGNVTPESTFFDEGKVKVGIHTIHNSDFKANGEQTMIDVLQKSLNTGAIYAMEAAGKDSFIELIDKFGFGQLTGIELATESAGNLSSLDKKGDIWAITASFGQGITATPMQMVMSFAAIANGGTLMKPYIVDKTIGNDDEITTSPKVVRDVISKKTATLLSGMLVSVVNEGHATKAGVPGYTIAGKTGTAQAVEEGVAGYSKDTIHSFAGFGPVNEPAFAMVVKIEKPQIGRFSSSTAAPLFGDIAKFLMDYYSIPPDLPR